MATVAESYQGWRGCASDFVRGPGSPVEGLNSRNLGVESVQAKQERPVLSRNLSEFLVELSIALHRHSMYPSGHPSLGPAVASVVRHAERLLQDRATMAFGVARRQLVIEGVTTDPNQPVLRRLAEGLHRHHLGAISVMRGIEASETGDALRALSAEPDRDGPLGLLRSNGHRTDWPHIKLHPLTFDRLAIVGDAPMTTGGGSQAATRGAELWVGLARAAISVDGGGAENVSTEPSVVARAIDEHRGAEAYDQVIVGYLLQIARELKTAPDEEAGALRRRTSTLIAALRPETLRRLVEMGGDVGQRGAFVLDATHGMAVDAVVEIVKAAGEASGQTISHGLVRMLSKLATHAELGSDQVRPLADTALRDQVQNLLDDWKLEDPNPEQYGRVLQHLATTSRAVLDENGPAEPAGAPEPLRVVQMSLEAGAQGPLLDRAVDNAMAGGQVGAVLLTLTTRPDGRDEVCDAVQTRLVAPSTVRALLAQEPVDVASLDELLPFMWEEGYELLLDALVASESRATRRKLLDRLAGAAVDLRSSIAARLDDPRWYVQRNMLVLLTRSRRVPEGFSAARWTAHEDARVRIEAVRLQLMLPHEHDLGVRTALDDSDPRIVRLGLAAIQYVCPPDLVARVTSIAVSTAADEEVRGMAVGALAQFRQPQVLEMLLQLLDGGKTILGRPKLAPKSPAVLAALRGLADQWPSERRAQTMLTLGADSVDADVRHAAQVSRA
jgi:hypothetical protein